MTKVKPKLLRAVHANRGIEAKYQKALVAMIDAMFKSVEYWVRAAYNKQPPLVAGLALDASPAKAVRDRINQLADDWISRFEESAPKLAEVYANSMFGATDKAFEAALREAGWSVKFQMTSPMKDALDAVIGGNVALIKSIPEEFLSDVQGIVMRSYANGRDLDTMSKELRERYGVTRKRAALIARDQSNKANSVVDRTRKMELGIVESVWLHSHAGKNPRADHVMANGKKYNTEQGCRISGQYIHPGEEINCRCVGRGVLPF